MDERVMQFRVGVMVIGAVLVAAILALMFKGLPSPFQRTYTIYVKFPSAPGLSVGAAVRKSGVRIGEVSSVELAPDDQVLVALAISSKYHILHGETCLLQRNLLGEAWLEFEPARATGDNPTGSIVR